MLRVAACVCNPGMESQRNQHGESQRSGTSSRVLGVNMGHRALGTNAWHFMRRLGVNGARLFLYSTIACAASSVRAGEPSCVARYMDSF